jgi:predicted esterase
MATRIENIRTLSLLTVALLSGLCATSALAEQNTLPSLKLDSAKTTVSGLSSGAYMAHQLHLAYSDRIAGAALLAGGPYHCAEGKL